MTKPAVSVQTAPLIYEEQQTQGYPLAPFISSEAVCYVNDRTQWTPGRTYGFFQNHIFVCLFYFQETYNTLTEKSRIIPVRRLIPVPVILPSRAKFQSWMWAVRGITLCLLVPAAGTVSSLRSNPSLPAAFILQSCGVRYTHTPKRSSPTVIPKGLLQKHAAEEPHKIYERRDHTTSQSKVFYNPQYG